MRKLSFFSFSHCLPVHGTGTLAEHEATRHGSAPLTPVESMVAKPGRERKREEISEIRASLTVVGSKKKMEIPIYNTRSDHFFLPSSLTHSYYKFLLPIDSVSYFTRYLFSNIGNQQQNSTMKFSIFSVLLVATIGAQAKQNEPKKKEAPFVSLHYTLPYLSRRYLLLASTQVVW